jgi:hypothetical protein
MARQREWPRAIPRRTGPPAVFAVADGYFNTDDRPVAGPLRFGTTPNVGPRGRIPADENRTSDFGMDRIEQRPVDSIGVKYPEVDPPTTLISRHVRRIWSE